jgi:hypothetical protein
MPAVVGSPFGSPNLISTANVRTTVAETDVGARVDREHLAGSIRLMPRSSGRPA